MAIREKTYEGRKWFVCDRPGCPFDTFEKDRADAHKDEPHKAPPKAAPSKGEKERG